MDRLKDIFGDSQEVADELCTTADLIESEHGVFDYSYPLREAATHITGLYAEAIKQQAELTEIKAQNAEFERIQTAAKRYETLRTLNVPQFRDLYIKGLEGGVAFDDLVDSIGKEGQAL